MSIQIENLTPEQIEMCDIMWSFASADEYLTWYECLDNSEQRQADVLQRLIILESMEEMLNSYADANAVLKKFML
jgi:hypothetical protein